MATQNEMDNYTMSPNGKYSGSDFTQSVRAKSTKGRGKYNREYSYLRKNLAEDRSKYIECYVARCVHCSVWKPQESELDQRGHTVTLTASHTNNTHSRKRAEGHEPGAAKCWSPSTRWQRA